MCKPITPITFTGPTVAEFDLAIIRPTVACAVCGSPAFVDGDELFCLDCPVPFTVPEAAR